MARRAHTLTMQSPVAGAGLVGVGGASESQAQDGDDTRMPVPTLTN